MKWKEKDAAMYLAEKEYVDTAVIPLMPVTAGKDMQDVVKSGEFIRYFTEYLERQYAGRVYLFPAFTYIKTKQVPEEQLKHWQELLREEGFNHFLFITSDASWRRTSADSFGELFWIPAFSVENMEVQELAKTMEQQVQQLVPLMMDMWQSEEK
ncbi:DUF2487 family protein [Alkalicoccus urumqiensis]|nr:DUF2487 family protein [Alkalicoccus urumqiensis]